MYVMRQELYRVGLIYAVIVIRNCFDFKVGTICMTCFAIGHDGNLDNAFPTSPLKFKSMM